ncbi:hypothetical protein [Phytohabitans houttuyneae]|uniref:hypothetical protein n=1 Tax=Phytohabitans houttuyneae TaxID=1076126 RepID=UPI0015679A79|nr:hypothetical protein [Phytohabitans houttuyneae]
MHPDDVRTVRETIGAVATAYRLDPAAVRVRLTGGGEPGGPMLVQVNFRVGGAPARIQVAASPAREAVVAAVDRLRRQIDRLTRAWHPGLGRSRASGRWVRRARVSSHG